MTHGLLTLCIPTYNRALSLRRCLLSIVYQLSGNLKFKVAIVVSDNNSTDDTSYVVKTIASLYPDVNLRYFKNKVNVGGFLNFNIAATKSESTFFWFVGDDSIVLPGAIQNVVDIIEGNDFSIDFIFLGGNNTLSRESNYVKNSMPNDAMFFTTRECYKFLSAFTLERLGNISHLLFRKDLWLRGNYVDFDKRYIYPHLKHVLSILEPNSHCCFVLNESVYCARDADGHNSWYINNAPYCYLIEFPCYRSIALKKGMPASKNSNFLHDSFEKWIRQALKVGVEVNYFEKDYLLILRSTDYFYRRVIFIVIILFAKTRVLRALLLGKLVHKIK